MYDQRVGSLGQDGGGHMALTQTDLDAGAREDIAVIRARLDELEARCWWCGFGRKACKCREWVATIKHLSDQIDGLLARVSGLENVCGVRRGEGETLLSEHDRAITDYRHRIGALEAAAPKAGADVILEIWQAIRELQQKTGLGTSDGTYVGTPWKLQEDVMALVRAARAANKWYFGTAPSDADARIAASAELQAALQPFEAVK